MSYKTMKELGNMASGHSPSEITESVTAPAVVEEEKSSTSISNETSKPSSIEELAQRTDALTERVERLELRVPSTHWDTINQFLKTVVEPNKNFWMGALVGLAFRFL